MRSLTKQAVELLPFFNCFKEGRKGCTVQKPFCMKEIDKKRPVVIKFIISKYRRKKETTPLATCALSPYWKDNFYDMFKKW